MFFPYVISVFFRFVAAPALTHILLLARVDDCPGFYLGTEFAQSLRNVGGRRQTTGTARATN